MSVSYFTIQSANDVSAVKIKVLFDGFAPVDTPMQTVDRTVGAKLSINQNGDRAFVNSKTGTFKVKQTPDSGYASLAKVKLWMTSSLVADRILTVYDELGVGYFMEFVSPFAPLSLGIVRDATNNSHYIPFELQEI